MKRGKCLESWGIKCAEMAGIPKEIIERSFSFFSKKQT